MFNESGKLKNLPVFERIETSTKDKYYFSFFEKDARNKNYGKFSLRYYTIFGNEIKKRGFKGGNVGIIFNHISCKLNLLDVMKNVPLRRKLFGEMLPKAGKISNGIICQLGKTIHTDEEKNLFLKTTNDNSRGRKSNKTKTIIYDSKEEKENCSHIHELTELVSWLMFEKKSSDNICPKC